MRQTCWEKAERFGRDFIGLRCSVCQKSAVSKKKFSLEINWWHKPSWWRLPTSLSVSISDAPLLGECFQFPAKD